MKILAFTIACLISSVAAADPQPVSAERKTYLGGGALYLPIDDGYFSGNITVGQGLVVGAAEYRIGGKLSYGYSPYASVGALTVNAMILHWWDANGLGLSTDVGALFASQKMGGGWDGTMIGGILGGTFRHRFDRSEISFDLGLVYKPDESDPVAPTAVVSALVHL